MRNCSMGASGEWAATAIPCLVAKEMANSAHRSSGLALWFGHAWSCRGNASAEQRLQAAARALGDASPAMVCEAALAIAGCDDAATAAH